MTYRNEYDREERRRAERSFDDSSNFPDRSAYGRDTGRAWEPEDTFFHERGFFDRNEDFFGSGRMYYGEGIESWKPNSDFGRSWRDSTGRSRYDYPERGERFNPVRQDNEFGQNTYGLERFPDRIHRREQGRHEFSRDRHDTNYQDRYPDAYRRPSSESGYYTTGSEERSCWDRAADEISSWFGDEDAERRREMDAWSEGHRGRGPRNYTRSDDRIREDINDRLTDFDFIDASDVDVRVDNGNVTLDGFVAGRQEKRAAERIARDVSGVRDVENRIDVKNDDNRVNGTEREYPQPISQTGSNREEVWSTHHDDETTH
jgi:osmotically-inducible protein OsmY